MSCCIRLCVLFFFCFSTGCFARKNQRGGLLGLDISLGLGPKPNTDITERGGGTAVGQGEGGGSGGGGGGDVLEVGKTLNDLLGGNQIGDPSPPLDSRQQAGGIGDGGRIPPDRYTTPVTTTRKTTTVYVPQRNICNNATGFRCLKSYKCINEKLVCNGVQDCSDGSDEANLTCQNKFCLNHDFSKAGSEEYALYFSRCANIRKCTDIIDEASCYGAITTVTTPLAKSTEIPPAPGSCIMPEHPQNGIYVIGQTSPGTYKPGAHIPPFQALVPQCNPRYKPSPPNNRFSVCIGGKWEPPPSTCSLSCDSQVSSETTNIKCKHRGIQLDSCENAVDGTIATITCEPLHEEPTLERFPDRICRNGRWNPQFVECYPMCGVKRPEGVPNIINGTLAKRGSYPWHIGIYDANTKNFQCGGSILSRKIILSAAHCFTRFSNGEKFPKENYLIAAGKYYSKYNDERDLSPQYSTVDDIHIPNRYKGEVTQYEADIAIVVLSTKLNFSLNVLPVCLDLRYNAAIEMNVITRVLGTVVGWGKTEEFGTASDQLKELSLPVILYDQCDREVPKDFRRFLTYDKICAGFLDQQQGTCQGDSGGGLVFPEDDRYYVRGIVSTAPATRSRTCDSNQYSTYTLVSVYLDFIKEYVF